MSCNERQEMQLENPFQITTPENLSAKVIVNLFVDVFTDSKKISDPGHVFIMGPRGIGKSMMFRYLECDCQCLRHNKEFSQLPFLGIHIPIKQTNFGIAELKRLESRHASVVLNEHIMVSDFTSRIFDKLAKLATTSKYPCSSSDEVKNFFNDIFLPTIAMGNLDINNLFIEDNATDADVFSLIKSEMNKIYLKAIGYTKKLSFISEAQDLPPYEGPLLDFLDFLVPICENLLKISYFPRGPFYLLIDDAHSLTKTQTKILNSWVATRTSMIISLKVSSQYNYKTFYTTMGATIDTPHDYSKIDMATIYTGNNKSKYRERIFDIVKKRFDAFGIAVTPEEFFPCDEDQEKQIESIGESYKKRYDDGQGKGFYRSDDALRYARPDYIKSLGGKRKSSSSYSYAGFNQLVHLSSGAVRYFLTPAHKMYAEEMSRKKDALPICAVSTSIQNIVVRKEADDFLFSELDDLKRGEDGDTIPEETIDKLSNLIQGLGGLFRQILLSARSERRVFSVALSDALSPDVQEVLELGVCQGYFHQSTIGRKNSKSGGRTKLYVMNRRLAPIWTLDPTGFSGYLFVTNQFLKSLIEKPFSLLGKIERNGLSESIDHSQLSLFDESETATFEILEEVDTCD